MSSILKALKKLESVPPPEQGRNTLQERIARTPIIEDPRRALGPFVLSAGGVVLLVGVFLAGRFFTTARTSSEETQSATAPQSKAVAERISPRPKTPEAPERPADDKADLSPADAEPHAGGPGAILSDSQPSLVPKPQHTPRPVESPRTIAARPRPPSSSLPERFPDGYPMPREEIPQATQRPSETAAQDPDITLEGIVWSDSPEDRFAVINGKIVRQGDLVEGVRVKVISMEHVLVRSLDGTWERRLSVR